MSENSNQPRDGDAVLGGQNLPPLTGAVLGGLAGVKHRLASAAIAVRLAALQDTLNYGKEGLKLAIASLKDPSSQVQKSAYLLLRQRTESEVREALKEFNPYQFFECVLTLKGHTHQVNSVAISPDGQTLASCGSKDGSINLWLPSTGEKIRTLTGHTSYVRSLAFSVDGQILVSGSHDYTVRLWQVSTGQEIRTLRGHRNWVQSIAISPDGKTLGSGSRDTTIKLWDITTGEEIGTFRGHTHSVYTLAFTPDGQILVSGSGDSTIKLWQLNIEQEPDTLIAHVTSVYSWGNYYGRVNSVDVSKDGQILASGGDNTVKLWRLSTRQEICTLTGHTQSIRFVTFSPDGQTLASGSWDKTIKLWQVSTGRELCTLTGHTYSVTSLAFSPDGQILVSGSGNKTVKIWRCN